MKIVKTNNFDIALNEYGDPISDKLAILMPGRLDTKDYINFVSHAEFLAKNGFFVASIDPPYTWDSPGDISNYNTTNYVKAVHELIEYFGNKKTLLLGHSRGGAVAMIASNNLNVEAVVLINAAYGYPTPPDPNKLIDGKLPEHRDLPPGDKRTEEKRTLMLPLNYFEDGNKHDPAKALREFKGAKLLIHANKDEFTDFKEVKEIYRDLHEPKMLLEIDCLHDYRLFPDAIDATNKAIKEFLTRKVSDWR